MRAYLYIFCFITVINKYNTQCVNIDILIVWLLLVEQLQ